MSARLLAHPVTCDLRRPQANVAQRRGRAGRVRPGESYHLYSRRRLGQMEEYETPELQRVPLETVVLNAKVQSVYSCEVRP